MPRLLFMICCLAMLPVSCSHGNRITGGAPGQGDDAYYEEGPPGRGGRTSSWLAREHNQNRFHSDIDYLKVSESAHSFGYRRFKQYCRTTGAQTDQDFCNGFVQAYVDICHGSNGVTPAVPPACYWSAKFRTLEGHARAQQWFYGYATGAAQADQDGIPAFNTVPFSPESAGAIAADKASEDSFAPASAITGQPAPQTTGH